MADKESAFVIRFDGTAGNLAAIVNAVKAQVRSAASDIERSSANIELFKGIEANLKTASAAFLETRQRVIDLQRDLDLAGGKGTEAGKALAAALGVATKAANAASREYNVQSDALARVGKQLSAAGIDTKNLAAEQQRLAAATKAAATAETERSAKLLLGLKTLKDVTPEIQRLRAAYNTLSSSGVLSVKELAQAQQLLTTRTAELRGSVTGVAVAAKEGGTDLAGFFTRSILPAIGLTASVATVVGALKSGLGAAREFQQGVLEIGTVTNLTKAQLDGLGAGARALATQLGLDVNEALKALFELIRSGVPPDNALEVLRVSAEASKAAITDLGAGVKAANVLLSAAGVPVKDLGAALDAVLQGAKDGGPTLKQFGESAGPLLNVARAANVPLNELVATLAVMTNATGNADQSIADLTKIIAKIDTAEAREKLRSLGIEGTGLVNIFQQIGTKGLGLNEILDLGVASTRSAAGIASLTNNAKLLPPELDRVSTSAGLAAKNVQAFFDSPKERAARFDAEAHSSFIALGELAGSSSLLGTAATALMHQFAGIPAAFREASRAADDENKSMLDVARAFLQADPLLAEQVRQMLEVSGATESAAKKTEDLEAATNRAKAALGDFSEKLLADVQALQAASARDISDIEARATAEIAALDRGAKARAATAATTLQIETKLATDRLAIIVKTEAEVTAALDKAAAARLELARKRGEDEKKVAGDIAQLRINALAPVLAQYQAHYNALIAQAQAFAAKQASIEQSRVELNRAIETEVRAIRLEGLSGLDQFVEKNREIDRLISEGRKAAAQGDIEAAKQFFSEAINESKSLTTAINADGVQIVTALQARTAKTEALKKIADAVNDSLGDQGKAAQNGAEATNQAIALVVPKLNDLKARYDELKRTVDAGLQLKAELDADSIAKAFSILDELSKPRTTTLTVEVEEVVKKAFGGLVRGFDVPGITGNPIAAQALAGGGPVFSRPSWRKVPGFGSGDIVPAALQAGSFVVRKAASEYYGDGLMSTLARYAVGGQVKPGEKRSANPKDPNYDPRLDPQSTRFDPSSPDLVGFYGDQNEDAFREVGLSIDPPTLPTDARELERKVLQYLDDVIRIARQNEPNIWGSVIAAAAREQRIYEQRPTTQNLMVLLNRARGIGLNLRSPTGDMIGYDIDGRRWHKLGFVNAPAGLAGGTGYNYDFYAQGGAAPALGLPPRRQAGGGGTDSVPAMLTPGEWVINRERAQELGSGFMYAVNSMQVPREALARLLAPPEPTRHYAGGGQVLEPGAIANTILNPAATGAAAALAGVTVNVTVLHEDLDDVDRIRRKLIPILDGINRRAR